MEHQGRLPVQVRRVQIEEGFLNGLDLQFSDGLNVIIGARGTGKTSIIELIRFALGSKNHTSEGQLASRAHAQSVLEGGEATITVGDPPDEVVVSRTASEDVGRQTTAFDKPIIFSQKEIESIGLSEAGRLSLIDGFVSERVPLRHSEERLTSALSSLHREMWEYENETARLVEGIEQLPALRAQRASVLARQAAQQGQSSAIAEKQGQLAALSAEISKIGVVSAYHARFVQLVDRWQAALAGALNAGQPEEWNVELGPDPLAAIREKFENAVAAVRSGSSQIDVLRPMLIDSSSESMANRLRIEEQARSLRGELNALSEGAGAIARELSTLDASIAQLEAVETLAAQREEHLAAMRTKRNALLSELDTVRAERFQARVAAAKNINAELGPRIKILVDRYAQYSDYTRAITDSLKGSGVKYNDISASISQNLSPRELIEVVESSDIDTLSSAINVPKDRAARIIGALRERGLGDIAGCSVEDGVRMQLLDGADYKDITDLSSGQRCTVILPIVLQHSERVIIIDQPEDHIDNAFIVDTLIKALKSRSEESQIIVTTHNPNIPVLGNASLVVQMVSDGRHGSVEVCKPLDHPDAVHAITSVMEGGEEAFQDRARFYKDHHI